MRYHVKVEYDMNFSMGSEIHEFTADSDDDAHRYLKELEGGWLSPIKRDVRVVGPLTRVVEERKP